MKKVLHVPKSVASALWSYDMEALDLQRDKGLIIKQVLDYGSTDAIRWVRETYPASEIRAIVRDTPKSAWGKKSLALWSLVYDAVPLRERRLG